MFIAIEGIDGSGKTTQSKLLARSLKKQGHDVLRTREPTQDNIGVLIRGILKSHAEIDPKALTYLFLADRIEHAKEIQQAIEEGKVVICDRYMLSTLAYQSAQGLDLNWLKDLHKDILKPDLTFLLDVDPRISMERLRSEEKFEKTEFQERARQAYLSLANEYENVHILHTSDPRMQTHRKMTELLSGKLPKKQIAEKEKRS